MYLEAAPTAATMTYGTLSVAGLSSEHENLGPTQVGGALGRVVGWDIFLMGRVFFRGWEGREIFADLCLPYPFTCTPRAVVVYRKDRKERVDTDGRRHTLSKPSPGRPRGCHSPRPGCGS